MKTRQEFSEAGWLPRWGKIVSLILAKDAGGGSWHPRGRVISRIYEQLRQHGLNDAARACEPHPLADRRGPHETVLRLLGEAVFDRDAGRRLSCFPGSRRGDAEILVDHARRRASARRRAANGCEYRSTRW